jgi:hypothetical protein
MGCSVSKCWINGGLEIDKVFRLIKRIADAEKKVRYEATRFEKLDEAVWAARENNSDYVIEEEACGVAPAHVVKYRLGEFEMG